MNQQNPVRQNDLIPPCPLCNRNGSQYFKSQLPYAVRSDWKPISVPIQLYYCDHCVHVYKDPQFIQQWSSYSDYHEEHDVEARDKRLFTTTGSQTRSEVIYHFLMNSGLIQRDACFLDFGCNEGTFLKVLPKLPASSTSESNAHAGLEIDSKYASKVKSVGAHFYSDALAIPTHHYDVVTMIHVLEHLAVSPELGRCLSTILKPDGKILVEVPYLINQITDAYIVDHCHHFSKTSLSKAMAMLGFQVVLSSDKACGGELTCISETSNNNGKLLSPIINEQVAQEERSSVKSIKQLLERMESQICEAIKSNENYLVYGASLIGHWLGSNLDKKCLGFIDDNPALRKQRVLNKPVYEVTSEHRPNMPVLLGVPLYAASAVRSKCYKEDITLIDIYGDHYV